LAFAAAGLISVVGMVGTARAQPRRTARIATQTGLLHDHAVDARARSIGSPTEGHLAGGARIEESPWLRIVPCHRDEDVRWGLPTLTSMIDRAARSVRKEFPDSVLSVGHLSRRDGGEVEMHASHESGRDADLGFYVVNQQGKSIFAEHFVAFVGDGTAPSWPGAKFDDARNWSLVASMVADGHAHVSYLFVASPLRARLLAYAQRIGAPYAIRVRASEVMAQPRGSLPHDDHFHVRISCPAGMEGCVEFPTRNLARAARLHARPRTHVAHDANATTAANAAATPHATAPAHAHASIPADDLPAPPATPAPPDLSPALLPPPATLDAPIDDVDGIEE
jgi:penicillin-insensitive murein endopeptidase